MQIHIIFDFGGGNAASLEGVSSFGATSSALYLIAIASTPVARLVSNLQRTLKWPRCDYVLNIKNNSTTSKRANAHDWLRDERTLASSSPCSTSSLRPGRQRHQQGHRRHLLDAELDQLNDLESESEPEPDLDPTLDALMSQLDDPELDAQYYRD